MKFEYGKPLKLRDDIKLKFYVDGIYPAGQLGYTEPHYKILFDEASLVISDSLAKVLFEEKVVIDNKTIQSESNHDVKNLKKLNKDDLIALAVSVDSSKDLTKLKKDELIEIINGK